MESIPGSWIGEEEELLAAPAPSFTSGYLRGYHTFSQAIWLLRNVLQLQQTLIPLLSFLVFFSSFPLSFPVGAAACKNVK